VPNNKPYYWTAKDDADWDSGATVTPYMIPRIALPGPKPSAAGNPLTVNVDASGISIYGTQRFLPTAPLRSATPDDSDTLWFWTNDNTHWADATTIGDLCAAIYNIDKASYSKYDPEAYAKLFGEYQAACQKAAQIPKDAVAASIRDGKWGQLLEFMQWQIFDFWSNSKFRASVVAAKPKGFNWTTYNPAEAKLGTDKWYVRLVKPNKVKSAASPGTDGVHCTDKDVTTLNNATTALNTAIPELKKLLDNARDAAKQRIQVYGQLNALQVLLDLSNQSKDKARPTGVAKEKHDTIGLTAPADLPDLVDRFTNQMKHIERVLLRESVVPTEQLRQLADDEMSTYPDVYKGEDGKAIAEAPLLETAEQTRALFQQRATIVNILFDKGAIRDALVNICKYNIQHAPGGPSVEMPALAGGDTPQARAAKEFAAAVDDALFGQPEHADDDGLLRIVGSADEAERLLKLAEDANVSPAATVGDIKGETALAVLLSAVGHHAVDSGNGHDLTHLEVGKVEKSKPETKKMSEAIETVGKRLNNAHKVAGVALGFSIAHVAKKMDGDGAAAKKLIVRMDAFFSKHPTAGSSYVAFRKAATRARNATNDLDRIAALAEAHDAKVEIVEKIPLLQKADFVCQGIEFLSAVSKAGEDMSDPSKPKSVVVIDLGDVTMAVLKTIGTLETLSTHLRALGQSAEEGASAASAGEAAGAQAFKLAPALNVLAVMWQSVKGAVEIHEGLQKNDQAIAADGALKIAGAGLEWAALAITASGIGGPGAMLFTAMAVGLAVVGGLIVEKMKPVEVPTINQVARSLLREARSGTGRYYFFMIQFSDDKAFSAAFARFCDDLDPEGKWPGYATRGHKENPWLKWLVREVTWERLDLAGFQTQSPLFNPETVAEEKQKRKIIKTPHQDI